MEPFAVAILVLIGGGLLWAVVTFLHLEMGESGAAVRRALAESKAVQDEVAQHIEPLQDWPRK